MVIYVGNFPTDTTEQQVREVFQNHGQVGDVRIMVDQVSQRGLGFGFVDMPDETHALKAIRRLHHTRLRGRAVMVCRAPERADRRVANAVDGVRVD